MTLQEFIIDDKYVDVCENSARDLISTLLESNDVFSILVRLEEVEFNPQVPQSIQANFSPLTLFVLAGYTLESAFINEDDLLIFEAGFGADDFGSVVSLPLNAVVQVLIEETPVFINMTTPIKKKKAKEKDDGIQASMNVFLNNPENEKHIK
jgi:hypothetical protein